ncbi:DUF485 domain-containing protein [Streptomyces fuscichromogenes]|uniref:DUF485 domain-containing protein n=1 Tax=Streptomyces fuscichromogenes TaxID=1324013 RepID=UPI003825B274
MSYDVPELPSDRPSHDPSYDGTYDRVYDRPSPTWSTGQEAYGTGRAGPRSGPHRTLRLLRRAYRWHRRVATLTALGYFVAFLTLTVKAPSLMARPGPGGLPTGLVLALVQIPVTWLAVLLYEAAARRFVDPLARRARRQARVSGADREHAP